MAGEDNTRIRVRFAPSPTGHLHIGGARTALYNWVFSCSQDGAFVLRIEDTDLKRSTDENIKKIVDSLKWLGLQWDEGPEREGALGPYRQTERLHLYSEIAENLIAEGKAYRCYCTVEELDKAREEAKRAGKPYVYEGTCSGLTEADEEVFKREGRSPVIRLKTPVDGKTVVKDLIRGDVEFENALTGDFILVRASGVPTYNLAAAVDDALMEISHVIRGDDHLPNTPKQILILDAIGKKAPVYAHLPLILGPDRTPLSKRHGSASVEELRDAGYLSEAVINYLALLGWSYDDKTTIFSVSELIEKFTLKRIGSNAAVFDLQKLTWMNGVYIREMEAEELTHRLSDYITGTRLAGLPGENGKPEIKQLVPLVKDKIKTLAEFITMTDFFFLPAEFETGAIDILKGGEGSKDILMTARQLLAGIESFIADEIEKALREAAAGMDIKLGKFLQPLRIAVSGKTVTPGMFETLEVLGRTESLRRIDAAIALLDDRH